MGWVWKKDEAEEDNSNPRSDNRCSTTKIVKSHCTTDEAQENGERVTAICNFESGMGWVWKKDEAEEDNSNPRSDDRCSTTKIVKSHCTTDEVEPGKFIRKCEKTEQILRDCVGRLVGMISWDVYHECSEHECKVDVCFPSKLGQGGALGVWTSGELSSTQEANINLTACGLGHHFAYRHTIPIDRGALEVCHMRRDVGDVAPRGLAMCRAWTGGKLDWFAMMCNVGLHAQVWSTWLSLWASCGHGEGAKDSYRLPSEVVQSNKEYTEEDVSDQVKKGSFPMESSELVPFGFPGLRGDIEAIERNFFGGLSRFFEAAEEMKNGFFSVFGSPHLYDGDSSSRNRGIPIEGHLPKEASPELNNPESGDVDLSGLARDV
ncbi:hypothetical protein TEA_026808 [Camellia sinensis var. sinensis]|uniref:Uncharacterized protein n=1 Tax=Camellia sinensis var. sinensis TaxID=542762 RepID=A0A4S4E976_CAMSN|nr:hypothetical protein TEA_026808 [Camellia sinensis var. sinensis]